MILGTAIKKHHNISTTIRLEKNATDKVVWTRIDMHEAALKIFGERSFIKI
jgi:hypothetical protein